MWRLRVSFDGNPTVLVRFIRVGEDRGDLAVRGRPFAQTETEETFESEAYAEQQESVAHGQELQQDKSEGNNNTSDEVVPGG